MIISYLVDSKTPSSDLKKTKPKYHDNMAPLPGKILLLVPFAPVAHIAACSVISSFPGTAPIDIRGSVTAVSDAKLRN